MKSAHKGSKIADPTFGKGVFWRDVAKSEYPLLATDIETDGIDLRHLPYEDASLDAVVLDPPFLHTPGTSTSTGLGPEESYRASNREKHGYDAAMDLYFEGGKEASRVLKPSGVLIVKCQDQVACGKNRWSHVEIMGHYSDLGFDCIDLFILAPKGRPATNANVKTQKHARKNHSYFLVFRWKKRVRKTASK